MPPRRRPSSGKKFDFLGLPGEIRNQIYEYYSLHQPPSGKYNLCMLKPENGRSSRLRRFNKTLIRHALLYLNTQIFQEYAPIAIKNLNIVFFIGRNNCGNLGTFITNPILDLNITHCTLGILFCTEVENTINRYRQDLMANIETFILSKPALKKLVFLIAYDLAHTNERRMELRLEGVRKMQERVRSAVTKHGGVEIFTLREMHHRQTYYRQGGELWHVVDWRCNQIWHPDQCPDECLQYHFGQRHMYLSQRACIV
jgi:hypothetical protein